MALLQDLIQQISDTALRERILQETDKLIKQKKFGLVYEEHLPECTPLYDMPISVGKKVALKTGYMREIYAALKIDGTEVLCENRSTHEQTTFQKDEIVTVAEFGEPIYPTLKLLDTVENAPENDLWHTLIEADNYHALQLLEYLYAGKVDCIYIDPPYNTGAKDWKYNNDYVDSSDAYRHSKWLSFMEKRLKLAKKLLNPEDSVLIVTIDEKEYLHLGCLLEEVFPEARIQMISSVISPRGAMRKDMFTRVEEYIYYVFMGTAAISPFGPDMLQFTEYENVDIKVWAQMIRTSANGPRTKRPNLFYPVFFDKITGAYVGVGNPLPVDMPREEAPVPDGCFAVFPIRRDGLEVSWALQTETFKMKIQKGYIKFGKWSPGDTNRAMAHLQTGTMSRIENGEIEVLGKDEEGTVILGNTAKAKRPSSVWNMQSHDAGSKGKNMLTAMLPYTDFTYPKSLYAVKDSIRFFVNNKPNALIVDFFAGSGTTMHAVNLLNAEDGGSRRCIMITNNEVSAEEMKSLTQKGLQPGDEAWETYGIAKYITWPRTICSIKGKDVNGKPLSGQYIGCNITMSEGFKTNAAFFKLSFLDKTSVALGKQFKELLPVLWMKGGSIGRCPTFEEKTLPNMMVLLENKMAILIDEIYYPEFDAEIELHPELKTVYIVTDSEGAYREMTRNYDGKECYQLYRDYLDNFRINTGR